MVDVFSALQAGGSIGAGLASVLGGDSAADQAKSQQRQLLRIGQTAFSPVSVFGPGGSSVTFGGGQPAPAGSAPVSQATAGLARTGVSNRDIAQAQQLQEIAPGLRKVGRFAQSDIGSINFGVGDQDPARGGLTALSLDILGNAAAGGAPTAVQDAAFANLLQGLGTSQGTLDALLGGAGGAFGGALQGLQQAQNNPFLGGLAQSLGLQGGQAFGALPGTQEQARNQTLDLLRQQAAPFEERAFSDLQDRLFATGQIGTTGGGLQTEAFARGLGQADLQRQIAAGEEGRAAQQAQLGLAQGTLGAGTGLASLQDALLGSATNRFSGIANLASGLGQSRFNQGLSFLQNALLPQTQAQALQSGNLQNVLAALGGIQGIDAAGLNQAQLALNAAQAQANARVAGTTAASAIQIPGSNTSTALAQLSQALAPEGGAFQALRNAFS